MLKEYFVNKNPQANGDHEVHHQGCSFLPDKENRVSLGFFENCIEEVKKARKLYPNSDGCYFCCISCHSS